METVNEVRKLLLSLRKNFHCAICLDLLTDPISTNCNHQFCGDCFKGLISSHSRRNPSKCPLCKTSVTRRSVHPNPTLSGIVSAVRNVCGAADDDCLNIGSTPILSQRVRPASRTKAANEAKKKGKKCLSFVGFDEEEDTGVAATSLELDESNRATKSGTKSSVLPKKKDFFAKQPNKKRKKKDSHTGTKEGSIDTVIEVENDDADHSKENLHPDRVSELLPPADISISLDTCDQDALAKIYNSQNNLLNRLKKRQETNALYDQIQPEHQEKQERVAQKRKSDELAENPSHIVGKKKKIKFVDQLDSIPARKGCPPFASVQPGIDSEYSIDADSSDEIKTQNVANDSMVCIETKNASEEHHTRSDSSIQQNSHDKVPPSVSTEESTPQPLPHVSFNLETISNKKVSNVNQNHNFPSEDNSNKDLPCESSGLLSNRGHSDVISPSPYNNHLNKSLVDNEVIKKSKEIISSQKSNTKLSKKSKESILSQKSNTKLSKKSKEIISSQESNTELSSSHNENVPSKVCKTSELECLEMVEAVPIKHSGEYMVHSSTELFNSAEKECESIEDKIMIISEDNLPSGKSEGTTGNDYVNEIEVNGTPEMSMHPDANEICTPESSKVSMEKLNEKNDTHSTSLIISPKTPTSKDMGKRRFSSQDGIHTMIIFPKTPKASQIVRIEQDSDWIYLMKKIPSPNKDNKLFGNLSFSKVDLPYQKGNSLRESRQSIRSRKQLLSPSSLGFIEGSELLGVGKVDNNSNHLEIPNKVCSDKVEDAPKESTEVSEVQISGKLNIRRKSRKKKAVKENDEIKGAGFIDHISSNEEKFESEASKDNTAEESCSSVNSRTVELKKSKTSTKFSNDVNEEEMSNELTGSTYDSNSFLNNRPSKKLNSKHRRSTRKKGSKSVNRKEETEHAENLADFQDKSSSDRLHTSHSPKPRDKQESDLGNSKCQDSDPEEEVTHNTNENNIDKISHDSEICHGINKGRQESIVCNVNHSFEKQNVPINNNDDMPLNEQHLEASEKSFGKSPPLSEELIPPTPPSSNVASRLNVTEKLYNRISLKTKMLEPVAEVSDTDLTEAAEKVSKPQLRVLQGGGVDGELSCSDQAFFNIAQQYEAVVISGEGRDTKSDKVMKNTNMIVEDLDSSFTCTDKILFEEDLTEVYTMPVKTAAAAAAAAATTEPVTNLESKSIVDDEMNGIGDDETMEELEHDIEVYTGGNKMTDDIESEALHCLIDCMDDEDLSASILTAPPPAESIAHEREQTDESSDEDKTCIEEIMHVKGDETKTPLKACLRKKAKNIGGNKVLSSEMIAVSDIPITADQGTCNTDFRESEETDMVSIPSTGKKFRQSLKNIITEESEGSKPLPSQNSVDFSVLSPEDLGHDHHGRTESTPSRTKRYSAPRTKKYSDEIKDIDISFNSSDGNKSHRIKDRWSGTVKKTSATGDRLLYEEKPIEIDDDNDDDDEVGGEEIHQLLPSKRVKSQKLCTSFQDIDKLSKKLRGDLSDDENYAGTSKQKQKKFKSEATSSDKQISDEVSILDERKGKSFEKALKANLTSEDHDTLEDQLFSPIPRKILGRHSKLKSTKRKFLYNADNWQEQGLKPISKSVESKDTKVYLKDELLSKRKQNRDNGRTNFDIHSSVSDDDVAGNISDTDILEEYKSPPKVKRVSDENIPLSLRGESSERCNDITLDERFGSPRKSDDLLDDSIWKISNMQQSSSKKDISPKTGHIFVNDMFSPPTPVSKHQDEDINIPGLSKKKSAAYRNRYLDQKIFSPPNSKILLDESAVEDNSPKSQAKEVSPGSFKSELKASQRKQLPIAKTKNYTHESKYLRTSQNSQNSDTSRLNVKSNQSTTPQNIKSDTYATPQSTKSNKSATPQNIKSDPYATPRSIKGNQSTTPQNMKSNPSTMPRKSNKSATPQTVESDISATPRSIKSNKSTIPQNTKVVNANQNIDLPTVQNITKKSSKKSPDIENGLSKSSEKNSSQKTHADTTEKESCHVSQVEKRDSNHDLSLTTPLKTNFIPLAQSTAFREQQLPHQNRERKAAKKIPDSTEVQPSKGDTEQKTIEHGTPTSRNIKGTTNLPIAKAHSISTDNDALDKPSPPVIMTSRLTKKQMAYCYAVCQKLGGKIVQNYSDEVTHLIVSTDENDSVPKLSYTYKYLISLVSGHWIVTLKWLFISSQNGKFVDEEKFEVKGDPLEHHTNIPRLYRTASQAKRRCLFENYRMYVVGTFQQTQISREQLFILLQKCGVEVIFSHTEVVCPSVYGETVLLTDHLDQLSEEDIVLCNKQYVRPLHPDWVVESIINFRVEDTMLYMLLQPADT